MKNARRIAPFLFAGAAACLAACDDDANQTDAAVVDQMVSMDMAPEPEPDMMVGPADMANLDMNPDMTVVPDAEVDAIVDAVVDMMVVDAELEPDTAVPPGGACVEDDECVAEGEWRRCVDEECRIDLRPTVYVVDDIVVNEPAQTAQLIQMFLADAVEDHMLNLIVEPGGYNDMSEYLWYIGNGGFRANEYDYLGNYPVQNFWGVWRQTEADGLYWAPDERVVFKLNVPTGQVENAEGMQVSCISQIETSVDLRLTPGVDENGDPQIAAVLSGVLSQANAERVRFRLPNGAIIELVDLLDPADLTDEDGDGTIDGYRFGFEATASPVVFIGDPPAPDGSNRDPDAQPENDPNCNQ